MKYILFLSVLFILFLNKTDAQVIKSVDAFFSPSKLTEVGVYYYPEQWNRNLWDRDLKHIADMGYDFTHFAEFAWTMMEPTEGEFDFKWLDEALEIAAKNNLKVVMCTPSATPPAWMCTKYPEILVKNFTLTTMQMGSRQQGSWSSLKYRNFVSKIVVEMAKRYGDDKRVCGWQIDNEPSHYWVDDFSDGAQNRFIEWLKVKYLTIGELNKTWGNQFWSQNYQTFDQVKIPNSYQLIAQSNPHAVLDFKRFQAQECASFISMQAEILRKFITTKQYVTTNYIHFCDQTQPDLNKDLDFVSYTIYPVGGLDEGYGEQGFRTGNSCRIGFANDYFRNITGNTGVFEIQPGQVNWGPKYNPLLYPGAVRMWIWHIIAGGNKFVCSYRFRQPLYGVEQYHHGIMLPDGITPSQGGKEYLQVMEELKKVRKLSDEKAATPDKLIKRNTAVLFNMDNHWETNNQRQTAQWSYEKHFYKYYDVFKKMGLPVSFIQEDANFSHYPFLIAPAYQLLDSALVKRWEKYVTEGGNLILTCRTGQKDRNAHLWEGKYSAPITDLIGANVKNYDALPDHYKALVSFKNKNYEWNNWGDILEAHKNTEVLAAYANQFYKDQAAIVSKKIGKGSITYIGVDTDEGILELDVLREIYLKAGISTESYPEGLIVEWRSGLWYAVNYSTNEVELKLPLNSTIIIGNKLLKQTDVLIWKE